MWALIICVHSPLLQYNVHMLSVFLWSVCFCLFLCTAQCFPTCLWDLVIDEGSMNSTCIAMISDHDLLEKQLILLQDSYNLMMTPLMRQQLQQLQPDFIIHCIKISVQRAWITFIYDIIASICADESDVLEWRLSQGTQWKLKDTLSDFKALNIWTLVI